MNNGIVPLPSGLNNMAARLKQHGGFPQQDRMIMDKRRSMDKATMYSYQGAKVQKVGENQKVAPALINPNKLTMDYDNKIISEGNTQTTQAAVRGPVETKIDFIQKSGISVDEPNHSLNIILPKNEKTLEYFRRYKKFYLRTLEENEQEICWRIEGFDTISTPGIIEITAVEYYINEAEDDLESGVAGGLIVDPIPPEPASELIVGENFIKPKVTYEYTYTGSEEGEWELTSSNKTILKTIEGKKIKVKWQQSYGGQFTLRYGSAERVIVVDSFY